MIKISPNPLALSGNMRVVEFLNCETGSDRIPQMIFHYEACTFVSEVENAPEIVQFRKLGKLVATNEIKVDEQGAISEKGTIGEYDFYKYAMFSGKFTEKELIEIVIKRADENKRFD